MKGIVNVPGASAVELNKVQTIAATALAAAQSAGGSAEALQQALSSHTSAANPHNVTPEQIGAAAKGHTHTAAEVGAAASSHTHPASQITGKLYAAQSTAPSNTNLLWIDTANSNIIKYHNGSAWVATGAVWG